jgi:hypothetical protein
VETFASTAGAQELLPEGFGIGLGFWIGFAGPVYGGIGEAEHDAPDHAQDQRRIGGAHPAVVLLHADIQAVVQTAFNDPVSPFEAKHSLGLQLLQREAAEQEDDFARPLSLAFDSGFQAGRQPGSRKAHPAGRHLQAL